MGKKITVRHIVIKEKLKTLGIKRIKKIISEWKSVTYQNRWYAEATFRNTEELIWANVYHDSIINCMWMPEGGLRLYPGRWAIGYNALYVIFRILNDVKPEFILEIGMGQSTRIIGQYANSFKNSTHVVIEHDSDWVDTFEKEFELSDKTIVKILKLEDQSFLYKDKEVKAIRYSEFKQNIPDYKYQFISIDGPYGGGIREISRIDILDIIPSNLAKSFCIVIDDYNRDSEKNMADCLRDKLITNHIEFDEKNYVGAKDVLVLTSRDYGFLTTL